jgi:hypothetical protein
MVVGSPPEPVFAGAPEFDASSLHEDALSRSATTASVLHLIHRREGRSTDLAVTDARSP